MDAQYFMELKALQVKEDKEGLTVRILKQAARRRYRARRHRRELQLAIHKAAADYKEEDAAVDEEYAEATKFTAQNRLQIDD